MTSQGSSIAGLLVEAARRWGTPVWVTDLDRAAANLAVYRAAFRDALVAYALKANADPQLLRRLADGGAGAEVVTAAELAMAGRAGFTPERIVMNGVGRTDAELAEALGLGVLVNAESRDDLDVLLRLASAAHPAIARPRIGIRLNPALDAATHPHLATGAAGSKFGIALPDLPSAFAALREANLPLAGLGAHIGSDLADLAGHRALVDILARAVAQAADAGLEPARIDLGGGPAAADAAALEALSEHAARRLGGSHRLILEPGRSLVADAGWLITRVVRVQLRPDERLAYLVADAGMTDLIRPVLYGADHPVSLLDRGDPLAGDAPGGLPAAVHLAGPVCEAGDLLARDLGRWLEPSEMAHAGRGALLAVANAGAYGAAMSMTYNGRPRAAEAVVEAGEVRLSRRRETLEDLVARDV